MRPVRLGIIGMGGYAAAHHQAVAALEAKSQARLVCTCDPQASLFATQQEKWGFGQRGIRVFDDYRAMLEHCHHDLDMIVIPTPIPLHAEMHRAAAERGLGIYLEKPPTLDYLELEQMITRERSSKWSALVGFNFIIERVRQNLKRRLLDGEFGAVRETRLVAQWARPTSYFRRNGWAGRLLTPDRRLVLDSCFGNAIAHFVHNMLFWAGSPGMLSWAQIRTVQAELFRAHAIEGADTFFVEGKSSTDVTMRFALSHACFGRSYQSETVVCEQATLYYVIGNIAEVRWADGRVERVVPESFDPLVENYLEYFRFMRGQSPRPATTLVDSRPFVTLNDLAYVSSERIVSLPAGMITSRHDDQDQMDYLEITGLADTQDAFVTRGEWPSARGWAQSKGPTLVTVADLSRLHATVEEMAKGLPPSLPSV